MDLECAVNTPSVVFHINTVGLILEGELTG